MADPTSKLLGAVLTGGASRRMGRDKSLLTIDGIAMVDRVANALRATCADIIAVGPQRLAGSLHAVGDEWPGEGPLGGIVTALQWATPEFDGVLAVACDLPRLDAATAAIMTSAFDEHRGADVIVARGERLEPLCAVWRTSCAPELRRVFEGGERAVHRAFEAMIVAVVEVDPQSVRNVNTPDDLENG